MTFVPRISQWRTRIRESFRLGIPELMGLLAWRRWRHLLQILMASTTWPAMCGSGSMIGIGQTITPNWRRQPYHAIQGDRNLQMIHRSLAQRSEYNEEAPISAPINIAAATWWALVVRAK